MNPVSIKKAKSVLKRSGLIISRIREREEARAALARHIQQIRANPSKSNILKLDPILEKAFEKERDIAMDHVVESKRVKELQNLVYLLTKKNTILKAEMMSLKDQMKDYERLKKLDTRRKKLVEKKVKIKKDPQEKIKQKINELDNKYKEYVRSGKFTKVELEVIKEKIDRIKNSL